MIDTSVKVIQFKPKPTLLRYSEAAQILSCTTPMIYAYVDEGKLTGYTEGHRKPRVDKAEVEAMAASYKDAWHPSGRGSKNKMCMRKHDLTIDGAQYANGACRKCSAERSRGYYEAKKAQS